MQIWIDARTPQSQYGLFGYSLTERILRALSQGIKTIKECPTRVSRVYIAAGHDPAAAQLLTAKTQEAFAVEFIPAHQEAVRLQALLSGTNENVFLVSADQVIDIRLIFHLDDRDGAWIAKDDATARQVTGKEKTGLLVKLTPEASHDLASPLTIGSEGKVDALAEKAIDKGLAKPFSQKDFPSFIRKLRRSFPFYIIPVSGKDEIPTIARYLFWSNYKGSTDVMTRYVYPPLVWLMVRPLANARIHPNWVTLVSIACTLAAVPFFMRGQFLIGFILAFSMSVLDSVDGKVARLTFTSSRLGNNLDHGLDLFHPPFWYFAWAWGLLYQSGTIFIPYPTSLDELFIGVTEGLPLLIAAYWLVLIYLLDRVVLAIYPRFFRRGLHTHAPIDSRMRSIIARRNINLPLFLIGYVTGFGQEVFYFIVAWQGATLLYHTVRTIYILLFDRNPNRAPAELTARQG